MAAVSACQPLRLSLRRRHDLVVSEQWQRGERVYVVKDPLALKYYRFSSREYAVLQWLDRAQSIDELVERSQRELAEDPLGDQEIKSFVNSLYASGLVINQKRGQGRKLIERRSAQRLGKYSRLATSLLSMRLPGIDPTHLLNAVYPWTKWFFSRRAMLAVALLAIVALIVLATRASELPSDLLAMHNYFGPGNWLLLALTFAVTKMLHELGHALACRRCGGECREIGVMLLVLTPCLYCDVSDSWMLPSKWRRAAIAAAGMYVEVTLAALATLVWSHSEPGTLHYLALQVILVCSVSTLLFNGNPLARYDGYYILADIVEVPNLRDEAKAAIASRLWRLVGIHRSDLPSHPSWPLTLFGLGVTLYRWTLLVSILWVLHHLLASRGLEVVWQCIAVSVLASVVVTPTWRVVRLLVRRKVVESMNYRRLIAAAVVIVALVSYFMWLPLPRKVSCNFETRFADSVLVVAPIAATLSRVHVEPHAGVQRGELIAQLRSDDLEFELARLTAEATSLERRHQALQFEQFSNPHAIELLAPVEKMLQATREQLAARTADRDALKLVAPRNGLVLRPPRRAAASGDLTLANWSGAPLDERNRGTPLAAGDVVCEIGDPVRLEAVLIVDQANVDQLAVGQQVELVCDAESLRTYSGQVSAIALDPVEATPPGLGVHAGGQIPSRIDARGVQRPASTSYSVVVTLDTNELPPVAGLRGTAKINTGRETLAAGAWRYLCRTFRFQW